MKKVICLTLLIMITCGIGKSMPFAQEASLTQENNKIDLSGNFPTTGARSLFEPIILTQYSKYLDVTFLSKLGIITIEIKDEVNNVIYRETIDTNIFKSYQIVLSDCIEGVCCIEFRNSEGKSLQGTFII